MSGELHILLIQPWTMDASPIERALRDAGIDATLDRVDFEAALEAALLRERHGAIIFDPVTPGLTRELVEQCMRELHRNPPVVELGDLATLGERVAAVLAAQRN